MRKTSLSVHICHDFKTGPWGGSNQFAQTFREFLISIHSYENDPSKANTIFFISHSNVKEVIHLKRKFPEKLFIHRLDGPVVLHNPVSNKRDAMAYWANRNIADATVFQSDWSRESNYKTGFQKQQFATTILNACSATTFNKEGKVAFSRDRKTRVIMTSWSPYKAKGFGVYQWLDDHLDFSRFELTFVGNSPVAFKNIKTEAPVPPSQLATVLKQHDIYITASEKDACSNALIEAMTCGLPAIALNDGGHPEIVKVGGKLFHRVEEVPACLDEIYQNYKDFQDAIELPDHHHMGHQYLKFIGSVFDAPHRTAKKLGLRKLIVYFALKLYYKFNRGFSSITIIDDN